MPEAVPFLGDGRCTNREWVRSRPALVAALPDVPRMRAERGKSQAHRGRGIRAPALHCDVLHRMTRGERQVRANTGRSPTACRTGHIHRSRYGRNAQIAAYRGPGVTADRNVSITVEQREN